MRKKLGFHANILKMLIDAQHGKNKRGHSITSRFFVVNLLKVNRNKKDGGLLMSNQISTMRNKLAASSALALRKPRALATASSGVSVANLETNKTIVYPKTLETMCIFNSAVESAINIVNKIEVKGTQTTTKNDIQKSVLLSLRTTIDIYDKMVPEETEETDQISPCMIDSDAVDVIRMKELVDDVNGDDYSDNYEFESLALFLSTYVDRMRSMLIPVPFTCKITYKK
jgi:hypothetical protein